MRNIQAMKTFPESSGNRGNRIDAAIFDMDGLMIDTERLDMELWRSIGAAQGYAIPESLILNTVGRTREDTEAMFREALGAGFDYHTVRKLRIQEKFERFKKQGVPLKTGLLSMLELLERRGIRKAVATSTERSQAEKVLRIAGLYERFDAVVCGDEISRGKPEPDIFLAAAEKLAAEPDYCLVLEDSHAGIAAAAAAGIRSIMIPDIKAPDAACRKLAERIFQDLSAAAEYVDALIRNQ